MDNISFTSAYLFKSKKADILYKLEDCCNKTIPQQSKTLLIRFKLLNDTPDKDGFYKCLIMDGLAAKRLELLEEDAEKVREISKTLKMLHFGHKSLKKIYLGYIDKFFNAVEKNIYKKHKDRIFVLKEKNDIKNNPILEEKLGMYFKET